MLAQNTFLEWSGNYSLRHDEELPEYVEREFKGYFKCGILAHGFARTYCANCRGDFIVAFSCKKRGVCPSCNTKHMIFITLHLLEEVLPKLPLRQWVLSVPKWLRYHLRTRTSEEQTLKQIELMLDGRIVIKTAALFSLPCLTRE